MADGTASRSKTVQLKGGTLEVPAAARVVEYYAFAAVSYERAFTGKQALIPWDKAWHGQGTNVMPFVRGEDNLIGEVDFNKIRIQVTREECTSSVDPGLYFYGFPGGGYDARKHGPIQEDTMKRVALAELKEEIGLRAEKIIPMTGLGVNGDAGVALSWAHSRNNFWIALCQPVFSSTNLDANAAGVSSESIARYRLLTPKEAEAFFDSDAPKVEMALEHRAMFDNYIRRQEYYHDMLRRAPALDMPEARKLT